jgi:uncharacterized membrane protein
MESNRRSTLDLVNVESVRDGGIIETPTAYAMLVEVEPREWLTLSEERRSGVYISFLTFLRGLQFPVQFLTMTTEFNGEQYFEQFVGPESPNAPSGESTPATDVEAPPQTDEHNDGVAVSATDGGIATDIDRIADSPLLEYGRLAHVEWLDRTLSFANVRDRRFFVAVGVDKGEADPDGASRFDGIQDALPILNPARTVDNEDFYLDEVWARVQRVASQLPRTRVETTILDSREAVLDVLYRVYRGHEPPISFSHGTLVRADQSALTDPATGEELDLESVFEAADRHEKAAARDVETEARLETVGDRPYSGRVQAEYVKRVDSSRLLQWYVHNVGPIGKGARYLSPLLVYLGTGAFVGSLLFAVAALGLFLGSGQGLPMMGVLPIGLRELSFILAGASLPTFLLSLVILLPSSQMAKVIGLLGTAVTGAAIYLFQGAYPAQWSSTPTGQTALVVPVYALGLFGLVAAVGAAVRSRRSILEAVGDTIDHDQDVDEQVSRRPEGSDA